MRLERAQAAGRHCFHTPAPLRPKRAAKTAAQGFASPGYGNSIGHQNVFNLSIPRTRFTQNY